MNLLEAIYMRRSVREFTKDPIDEGDLRDLIDAAIQAPNAMNRQAWRFVVVSDPALLGHIARDAKAHALKQLDQTLASAGLRDHLTDPSVDILHSPAALILIWTTGSDQMAVYDCCLAAENLMLVAANKGLGTCWIGFAESWLATAEAKMMLGLPSGGRPVAPIVLGHPVSIPPPPPRAPVQISWFR